MLLVAIFIDELALRILTQQVIARALMRGALFHRNDRIEQYRLDKNSISSSSKGGIDFFDILTDDEIARLKEIYLDHYDLIDECQADANRKSKKIQKPFSYIVGYASNVGWPER